MNDKKISNKCFLDTNLLIYALDNTEPDKKNSITSFLNNIKGKAFPVISTQTLDEFYNIAVKKLGLTKDQAYVICEEYSKIFPVYEISTENVFHAMEISKKTQFSYWDSLILAMAIDTGCSILYSEDLNNGQEIEGVKLLILLWNKKITTNSTNRGFRALPRGRGSGKDRSEARTL